MHPRDLDAGLSELEMRDERTVERSQGEPGLGPGGGEGDPGLPHSI